MESAELLQLQVHEINLSLIHIGMMLASWDIKETLPKTLNEVESRIFDTFGVNLRSENNLLETRNKIAAIIETWKDNENWKH